MSKVPFNKPPLTYVHQLQQLKDRGLTIINEQKALHLLESVSYYRLSGYWYPLLQDKQNHIFKQGATFETVFKLYCFDRELRKLVLAELEKVEVAIRAKMIYVLSHKYGAFWFSNPTIFRNPVKHADSITKIGQEYARSDEEFIKAFAEKYSDPLPPSWISIEITSFGTLSMLYSNLLPGMEKRAIAHHFGVADSVFQTWLHSIVYLRNICAHHSRLWNRSMSIRPQFPRKTTKQWIDMSNVQNNKSYFMLSMILYLLQTVNPKTTFSSRLKALLSKYNNVDTSAMNFPVDWENEPLWK
ncbi:Abi family protein [Riemerella anatipestifer]|uniref:Abi family protein n=1 Tax=Riemerella anatipestifer TaxID=34085 RepID=UPI0030BAF59C